MSRDDVERLRYNEAAREDGGEDGVSGVHASINDSDDAGTRGVEADLRVGETDNLRGGLGGISVHNHGPVVVHRSGVIEAGGDCVYRPLGKGEEMVGLNALNSKQLFEQAPNEAEEILDQVARRSHQVGLADVAVQGALDLAVC